MNEAMFAGQHVRSSFIAFTNAFVKRARGPREASSSGGCVVAAAGVLPVVSAADSAVACKDAFVII